MSDFGLLASRFNDNTNLLRNFDVALRYFKKLDIYEDSTQTSEHVEKLLYVLKPVSETLNGFLSKTMSFDEQKITAILKQRRIRDWLEFKEHLIRLTDSLSSGETRMNQDDFEVLNDVADAIDMECANLFRRISGRP